LTCHFGSHLFPEKTFRSTLLGGNTFITQPPVSKPKSISPQSEAAAASTPRRLDVEVHVFALNRRISRTGHRDQSLLAAGEGRDLSLPAAGERRDPSLLAAGERRDPSLLAAGECRDLSLPALGGAEVCSEVQSLTWSELLLADVFLRGPETAICLYPRLEARSAARDEAPPTHPPPRRAPCRFARPRKPQSIWLC